jgi:DNA-binding transcriptional LysR family regulator
VFRRDLGFILRTEQSLSDCEDNSAEGAALNLVTQGISLGIVKVANYVARPYLESGQPKQVLTDWTAEQFPISVMYAQSRPLSAKVRIFVDWVSELIRQDPILQSR